MATSVDDLKSPLFWRAVLAELIGTLFLNLVGCGACIATPKVQPTLVSISFAFGLSVAIMVWCIGNVSGGHINPAVTMAMLITRKISIARGLLFVVSQSLGAVSGTAILKGVHETGRNVTKDIGYGLTRPSDGVGLGPAFGVEFLITFVLIFTVFAACDSKRSDLGGSKPLMIGLSVTMCHLFAVPLTGSSMNPARSFGSAAIAGNWNDHWIYWTGPILGGMVAGLLYDNVFAANASINKSRGYLLTRRFDPESYDENAEKPDKITMEEIEHAKI